MVEVTTISKIYTKVCVVNKKEMDRSNNDGIVITTKRVTEEVVSIQVQEVNVIATSEGSGEVQRITEEVEKQNGSKIKEKILVNE